MTDTGPTIPLNLPLLANPFNWVIILLVVAFVLVGGMLIFPDAFFPSTQEQR